MKKNQIEKSRNKNIKSVKKNSMKEFNRKLDRTTERLTEIQK